VAGPATRTLGSRASQSPLSLTCPSNITVRATSPAGAVVTYAAPVASGGCPPVTINSVPPSGSTFPIGSTVVNCSVTDGCGGDTKRSFTVTVLPLLPARITSIVAGNGSSYIINYVTGPGSQFILLSHPKVTAPMSLWTPVATNAAGAGSFSVSSTSATFYRIQSR
jgi:hypothetical protein